MRRSQHELAFCPCEGLISESLFFILLLWVALDSLLSIHNNSLAVFKALIKEAINSLGFFVFVTTFQAKLECLEEDGWTFHAHSNLILSNIDAVYVCAACVVLSVHSLWDVFIFFIFQGGTYRNCFYSQLV